MNKLVTLNSKNEKVKVCREPDETPNELFNRVAKAVATTECDL